MTFFYHAYFLISNNKIFWGHLRPYNNIYSDDSKKYVFTEAMEYRILNGILEPHTWKKLEKKLYTKAWVQNNYFKEWK